MTPPTPLHALYQARWAWRNDPALGWVCCVLIATILDLHSMTKEFRRTIKRQLVYAAIANINTP